MSTKIDGFIAEIREWPKFAAAAASSPVFFDHLDNIERGLNQIDRKADSDPQIIEIFDKIENVLTRRDMSLRQRLLEVGKPLVQARDVGRITH